jgi:hypothetical protein
MVAITGNAGVSAVASLTGGTFSRASPATYFDQSGNLAYVPNDVMRIAYNPVTHACGLAGAVLSRVLPRLLFGLLFLCFGWSIARQRAIESSR